MPFFENARDFKIDGGEFNDIAGDLNVTKNNYNTNQTNSNNTSTTTATNSHNNSSRRVDRSPHTQYTDSRTVIGRGGTANYLPQQYGNGNKIPRIPHNVADPSAGYPTNAFPHQGWNPASSFQPALQNTQSPQPMELDMPTPGSNNPFRQQLPDTFPQQSAPLPFYNNPFTPGSTYQQQQPAQPLYVPQSPNTPSFTAGQPSNVQQPDPRTTGEAGNSYPPYHPWQNK